MIMIKFKNIPESLGLKTTKSGRLKIYDFENVSKDYEESEPCKACGAFH